MHRDSFSGLVWVHLSLFLLGSVVVLFFNLIDGGKTREEALKEVQRSEIIDRIKSETGLDFTPKSNLIHFYEPDRLIDPVWVAKVVIPASSYDGFKEAVLGKTSDNTTYHGAIADSTSWWKPTHVVLTKIFLTDDEVLVSVVMSKEGDEFAVYVECAVF